MFCSRHEDALLLAVGARGLANDVTFDGVAIARQAIVTHATHFAGRASIEMLTRHRCPLCFVNQAIAARGQNPGLTVDDWVDHAAEEAAQEQIRRQDAAASQPALVT